MINKKLIKEVNSSLRYIKKKCDMSVGDVTFEYSVDHHDRMVSFFAIYG